MQSAAAGISRDDAGGWHIPPGYGMKSLLII